MGSAFSAQAADHGVLTGLSDDDHPQYRAQSGFSAKRVAALTLVNNTFTSLMADTEDFDLGNEYNTTDGKYTPLVAGKYLVGGYGGPTANVGGSSVQAAIYKNGSLITEDYDRAPGTGGLGHGITVLVDMNGSTDYLEFKILQDSGGNQALATSNFNKFWAIRIP